MTTGRNFAGRNASFFATLRLLVMIGVGAGVIPAATGADPSLLNQVTASANLEKDAESLAQKACAGMATASREGVKQTLDEALEAATRYHADATAAKSAFLEQMMALAAADEKWRQSEQGRLCTEAEEELAKEKEWKEKLAMQYWNAKPAYDLAVEKFPNYTAAYAGIASLQEQLDSLENHKKNMSFIDRMANLEDIDIQIAGKKKPLLKNSTTFAHPMPMRQPQPRSCAVKFARCASRWRPSWRPSDFASKTSSASKMRRKTCGPRRDGPQRIPHIWPLP